MPRDHSNDLAAAAKAILLPIGCAQKGGSRTWLDDHGWWIGVVEFQPSGFSKGSYLNVAACWLWSEKDYLSFDDFAGHKPWREATEGQSFLGEAMELASEARDAVLALRRRHPCITDTAKWLSTKPNLNNWDHFHAGMAHGLNGSSAAARSHFRAAIRNNTDIAWMLDLNRTCASLDEIVGDRDGFVKIVSATIHRTRSTLGLPQIDDLGIST